MLRSIISEYLMDKPVPGPYRNWMPYPDYHGWRKRIALDHRALFMSARIDKSDLPSVEGFTFEVQDSIAIRRSATQAGHPLCLRVAEFHVIDLNTVIIELVDIPPPPDSLAPMRLGDGILFKCQKRNGGWSCYPSGIGIE